MSTSGKLDGPCTDLPMKEHNRALMNGDPWMSALQERFHREDKARDKEEIQD